MLTPDQAKTIKIVYERLLQSESNGWDSIDDKIYLLGYSCDQEIVNESYVLYEKHKNKKMGCPFDHPSDFYCPTLDILDSVNSILKLYQETENLHPKNRYILEYYLALTDMKMIVELK